ncbi:type I restriction endonuclease subunit S [Isachenkonia alkalipeptolytica]|uniref:Type I restriction endonuclease subunit S n=1 Tax=Isachenkonia alkalipeptolytica TaxID=2565777 RepID=A0AA44BEN8_9CLOT|nr:type I restriction endonuclease subunit S [Isachenkonia alkalipeptolytica]NBG88380.1 type I restriction endonuclease subunit S [Isachenkonia alkalipeptolytica]
MRPSRDRNIGWRIDYFIVSKALEDRLEDGKIYPGIYGSGHCPVGLEIDL